MSSGLFAVENGSVDRCAPVMVWYTPSSTFLLSLFLLHPGRKSSLLTTSQLERNKQRDKDRDKEIEREKERMHPLHYSEATKDFHKKIFPCLLNGTHYKETFHMPT